MREHRMMLWIRLLVGAGFMYQGVMHILGMWPNAELFATNSGWQGWPLLGSWRPLELVLWLAFAEFFLGVFLFGGLLTKVLSAPATIIAGLQLAALGLAGGPMPVLLTVGSAALMLRGGGSGTMDSTLGKMQRRSLERELEREAERTRAQDSAVNS